MSQFLISSSVNNGEPYISEEHVSLSSNTDTVSVPHPNAFFKQTDSFNDGVPYIDESSIELSKDTRDVVQPYPKSFFKQTDSFNDGVPYITQENIEWSYDTNTVCKPYPNVFFKQTDSCNESLPYITLDEINNGAFMNSVLEGTLEIPDTALKLGEYTIDGSNIIELSIPKTCDISETIIPTGVNVTIREEDE